MDGDRFDEISRSLARGTTRRGLLAGLAGIAAAVAAGRRGSAQVSQAQCGNVRCKNNPGKCNPGCVCCVFGNGNHRCTPPGGCGSSGQPVCPPDRPYVDPVRGCVQCLNAGHCPAPAGACEAATCIGGVCGVGPAPAGKACRPAAGPCDLAETCTGASTSCPADAGVPEGQPGACPTCQGCNGGACVPVSNDTRCPGVCCAGVCCEDGQGCVNGACQSACVPFSDTCDPAADTCCQDEPTDCVQTCGPSPTCCHSPGGTCGSNCDCCGLDTCDFDSNVCCRELGGSCAAGEPCCGILPCVGGVCCQEAGGGGCDGDIDCCGDLVCREGVCEAAVCFPPQTPCNPAENSCCQVGGYASCREAVGCGGGEPICCRDLGGACAADCDCCGEFDGCGAEGRCCRGLGGACSVVDACCPGFVCDAGSGATCRLPDGAFCAFDEECRAGARCVDNACRAAV